MITRAKADEAADILAMPSEDWTVELINKQYRAAARQAHPDAGGSPEAFARVDWAKHALLHWLKTSGGSPRPVLEIAKCESCNGKGWFRATRGFSMGVRQHCTRCGGTGDAAYDRDKTDGK